MNTVCWIVSEDELRELFHRRLDGHIAWDQGVPTAACPGSLTRIEWMMHAILETVKIYADSRWMRFARFEFLTQPTLLSDDGARKARVDFLLRMFKRVTPYREHCGPRLLAEIFREEQEDYSKTAHLLAVIECDGHDFHEKTKEQAARDKGRDRFLQAGGCYVLRFTGSEIYRNPVECGVEITKFLERRGLPHA